MALKVKQYRYYSDGNSSNYPSDLTSTGLKNGTFIGTCIPITQLGIQALPGTKFNLNDSDNKIVIGNTGIYELELDAQVSISSIRFDNASLKAIANSNDAVLIIDTLYGEEG